jgi:hypothetical protein
MSGKICLSISRPEVIGFQTKIAKALSVPKKTKDQQNGARSPQAASGLTAQSKASRSKTAERKSPAKRTRKTPASRKKSSTKTGEKIEKRREPSAEEIRQRAYFISERRAQLSLPADAPADWLEARRQLLAEAGIQAS